MRLAAWAFAAVVLTGSARPAAAQPGPLAPTGGPPERRSPASEPLPPGEPPPEPAPSRPRTAPDRPPNVLGAPVLGAPVRPANSDLPPEPVVSHIAPVTATEVPTVNARRGALGRPESAGAPLPPEAVEARTRTTYTPREDGDAVNELLARRSADRARPPAPRNADRTANKFGDKIGETVGGLLGNKTDWFRSDHAFDGFISPVTNPFLFEDPRSLTELRPLFIYQKIPGDQPDFRGGNAWFFGTQARVAVTDRLSFTFNKLGGLSFNPDVGSDSTGFAELWLGPKYTIIRGEDTGRLLAAGLQFQIPVGSKGVYQDTGDLSLVPYLTFGQNFGRDFRFGSFNFLAATGYAFSTDDLRSDYFWLSAHLDMDVLNNHRFYPLVELNWFAYTTNGNARPFGSEGRDLVNFGGQAKNTGLLTGAVGARFKLTESAQIGGAWEFPLAGPRGIFDYRFNVDFILRY